MVETGWDARWIRIQNLDRPVGPKIEDIMGYTRGWSLGINRFCPRVVLPVNVCVTVIAINTHICICMHMGVSVPLSLSLALSL